MIICCACGRKEDEDPEVEFIELEDGTYICIYCTDDDDPEFYSENAERNTLDF